ncbi:MAG: twin-arginine translocation signal domain-containing protein [Nitrospirae bacterium]|nr:twin-arginine translocation signal domain-containing protein [Nitrospirota bacterium]
MDRRDFMKSAALGTLAMAVAGEAGAAELFYPTKVDLGLFQTINRAKDPANKTPLEKTHAPYIKAPAKVTAGEPFVVEVSVGENLHSMGPAHWIEYIELNIGNEPAGRVDFQPRGYLNPKASFLMVLPKESASSGKVTLVAHQRCNLHGYWEGSMDIEIA